MEYMSMEQNTVNDRIRKAEEILDAMGNPVDESQIKRVKRERGLIERTESSKIILTEDNRQVLND